MDFVLNGILTGMSVDLKNKIVIIDNNKIIVKLEDGNRIEISSYKVA